MVKIIVSMAAATLLQTLSFTAPANAAESHSIGAANVANSGITDFSARRYRRHYYSGRYYPRRYYGDDYGYYSQPYSYYPRPYYQPYYGRPYYGPGFSFGFGF
jgi:hypothetical protein